MIARRLLRLISLPGRIGSSVVLKSAQLDQVPVKGKRRPVPDKTIHPITEKRHRENVIGVGPESRKIRALWLNWEKRVFGRRRRARTSPIQVDSGVGRKVWVQGDAQQSTL